MKIASVVIAGVVSLASSQAFAAEDANRNVSLLGVQGSGYVQVREGFSQPCQFNVVYLPDMSQYNARAMMAVLMSAQARGAVVSIAYDVAASGICTANKVAASS